MGTKRVYPPCDFIPQLWALRRMVVPVKPAYSLPGSLAVDALMRYPNTRDDRYVVHTCVPCWHKLVSKQGVGFLSGQVTEVSLPAFQQPGAELGVFGKVVVGGDLDNLQGGAVVSAAARCSVYAYVGGHGCGIHCGALCQFWMGDGGGGGATLVVGQSSYSSSKTSWPL